MSSAYDRYLEACKRTERDPSFLDDAIDQATRDLAIVEQAIRDVDANHPGLDRDARRVRFHKRLDQLFEAERERNRPALIRSMQAQLDEMKARER